MLKLQCIKHCFIFYEQKFTPIMNCSCSLHLHVIHLFFWHHRDISGDEIDLGPFKSVESYQFTLAEDLSINAGTLFGYDLLWAYNREFKHGSIVSKISARIGKSLSNREKKRLIENKKTKATEEVFNWDERILIWNHFQRLGILLIEWQTSIGNWNILDNKDSLEEQIISEWKRENWEGIFKQTVFRYMKGSF